MYRSIWGFQIYGPCKILEAVGPPCPSQVADTAPLRGPEDLVTTYEGLIALLLVSLTGLT